MEWDDLDRRFIFDQAVTLWSMNLKTANMRIAWVDLYLNGQELAGVPGTLPSSISEIWGLLGASDLPLENVLCSRRVLEIDVGTAPEPLRRFRNLVGLD